MPFRSPPGGWVWRPVTAIALAQLALGTARPALSYAAIDLGAGGFAIGLLVAISAVAPMLLAIPVGAMVGRFAHIAIVPAGSAIVLATGCVIAALAEDLVTLVIASALMGAGHLGLALGGQGWVSRSAPPRMYNSGFGWIGAAAALGQTIGPMLAGLIIGAGDATREGIAAAFWLAGAIVLAIVVIFASPAVRSYTSEAIAQTKVRDIIRTPGVARYIFTSAIVLTAVDILIAYMPLAGDRAGLSAAAIGFLLGVRGFTSMISRVFLGMLSRRISSSALLLWSTAGSAAALLVVALSSDLLVLFLAMVVGGFFLGFAQPLSITVILAVLTPRARSRALGVRMLGNQVAQVIIPLVAGVLALAAGPAVVFLAQAGGLIAASGWELAARRKPDTGDG